MLNCFSGCITDQGKPQQRSLKKIVQESDKTGPSIENLSSKTDGSQRRYITQELAKHGNGKNLAECFTYKELSDVTRKFNPECVIGEGGFGRVYKGHIDSKEIDVAIKQLDRDGFQGNREFLVEVLVLSRLHHQNLVNLVGYCAEGNHRLLVYEHMPNGSLEDHLLNVSSDKNPLDWNKRMKIIEGAARGLEYLHEIADPPVIYRDFKASNILLDTNFNPKLSDFGFAKLVPVDENENILTRVVGTYGYCAPEYASTGMLSTKSDVYSFGVVLLEMISGRRVIDTSRPSKERNMIEWAAPLLKDKKKFNLLVDPLLEGNYPEKELHQALAIAAMCLQEEADTRPFMADVVTALEYLSAKRNPADNSNKTDEVEEEDDHEEGEGEEKENEDDHDKNE